MAEKQARNKAAHLKGYRWQKGQSGNPNGRPEKVISITSALKAELDKVPPVFEGKPNKLTWLELIRDAWLLKCAHGDGLSLRELLERIEGKVTQPISSPEPLVIRFVTDEAKPV
jgi:hypothetical protein